VWKRRGEVAEGSRCGCEAESGDDKDEDDFEGGEDKLKIGGFLDAEIVEAGDKPSDGDGEDLRPDEWNGPRDGCTEPVKCGKEAKRAREADGDSRDGCGFGHGKPRPHVKECRGIAVGSAQVDIFAASVGQHGAEFGVGHGAEEREKAADDPGEVDEAEEPTSCIISRGTRKIPLPMMVPTTIAVACDAPRLGADRVFRFAGVREPLVHGVK